MLHVHRAERADGLVDGLCGLLSTPLEDPFATEIVSVPTRGIERWLTQRLSGRLGATDGRGDGVCANIDFPPPRQVLRTAVAEALGADPDEDPWAPGRLVWPLLEVIDAHLDDDWLAQLRAYIAPELGRRFTAARHLAELFDRYALQRPELARAWTAGEGDGWQPELWRRLHERIPEPDPAARIDAATAAIRSDPHATSLPERLALFGLTRLPGGDLEVLDAIAARREVHLFLLHPSPALWERVAGDRTLRRREAHTPARHRLLASWGRDVHELQLVVNRSPNTDHHHPSPQRTDTLLARIQQDVIHDREPQPHPVDNSIEIHACHGRARQVEILHDAVLHLLADDPTLEPRDVIVMCPDIEQFAPLIQATFAAGEALHDEEDGLPPDVRPPDLRVRLADRALRQTNPVLGAVARLVELADQRLTASQVLDLADRTPVRRRFRLDDDDIGRLQTWIADSGIRWGLDAPHRAPFKLQMLDGGTWRAGLDRVLLGVAMSEEGQRRFERVLPLDDVGGDAIDLTGRFAELVARLQQAIDLLAGPKPFADWADALARAADLLTATSPKDAWQRRELQYILDDTAELATDAPLSLPEVRALLADRLKGRPTRANFRTGHLTICTLVPMRSVPHRVVCLLGLDDAAFPRKSARDGDDLLLADPHVGERDPRQEDRQMLLDALMAATDKLIITYTGNDERTNAHKPAAVPVAELLDVIGTDIVKHHPLQPFDPRNFHAPAPWSFDRITLAGAEQLTHDRPHPPPFLPEPLPAEREEVVELDTLIRFVSHPVKTFLRRRLEVSVADFSDEIDDTLPVELDNLEQWQVGQRILEARLAGVDQRTACLAEIARGDLPPAHLAEPILKDIAGHAETIVEEVAKIEGDPASLEIRVALPDGRLLSGTVPGVSGDTLWSANYSRLGPKPRLTAWVQLLALSVAHPQGRFTAVTVGRAAEGDGIAVATIPPPEDAMQQLMIIVDLLDRGMREPLPLYAKTSAAYACGADPVKAWKSDRFPKEDVEPEHQLVLGGVVPYAALLDEHPRPDETFEPGEPTRFGRLARRLWCGLLEREVLR